MTPNAGEDSMAVAIRFPVAAGSLNGAGCLDLESFEAGQEAGSWAGIGSLRYVERDVVMRTLGSAGAGSAAAACAGGDGLEGAADDYERVAASSDGTVAAANLVLACGACRRA